MTERLVGLTFSDAEIRKMHLPLTDRPVSGLNDFCLLPAVGPGARAMTTRAVHLGKEDGSLACRVRREPDSLVTTDPRETTCPFCRGKKRLKGDRVGRRCEVCYQENGRHWTTPHIHRRKPDNCTCGHERDAHGWVLPCLCRACSCAGFVGRDDFSCDRWLKGQR